MLIKSWYEYLTIWIKDIRKGIVKSTCEVCMSSICFHVKISFIHFLGGGGGRGRGSPFIYSTITNNFLDATSKLPQVNILGRLFYQNQYDFVEVHW